MVSGPIGDLRGQVSSAVEDARALKQKEEWVRKKERRERDAKERSAEGTYRKALQRRMERATILQVEESLTGQILNLCQEAEECLSGGNLTRRQIHKARKKIEKAERKTEELANAARRERRPFRDLVKGLKEEIDRVRVLLTRAEKQRK